MKKERTFTYQTEIVVGEEDDRSLLSMAEYLSRVERCLFSEYSKGRSLASCKNAFLEKYCISARHFNAIRVSLEGKIASITALNKESIEKLEKSLRQIHKKIQTLRKKITACSLAGKASDLDKDRLKLHRAQRAQAKIKHKLNTLVQDRKEGKVRLCFGSKKLFHKQFHLEETEYTSHEEWKKDWVESRSGAFFTLGSKDESGGNQTCQFFYQQNGLLGLHLRLCDQLVIKDKYVTIKDISFAYGEEVIRKAIDSCLARKNGKSKKDPSYALFGQAISCRFKRKGVGRWTLFVTTSMEAPKVTTQNPGAIGVDINSNHLAVVEIDAQGNPLDKRSIPLCTYGKSRAQAQAIIGDAVAEVVEYAKGVSKPIVLENLDFSRKKEELSLQASYNRMLSSFAYGSIIKMTESRGYRKGVEILFANPSFTSVTGRVKYATRYGLSVHHSSALCIARKKIGFTEKIPARLDHIPDGKGAFIALALPVESVKLKKVSWHLIGKKLKAGLAAHFRTKRNLRSRNKTGDSGDPDSKFTEEVRYANR